MNGLYRLLFNFKGSFNIDKLLWYRYHRYLRADTKYFVHVTIAALSELSMASLSGNFCDRP
jgi:hypothetical protein